MKRNMVPLLGIAFVVAIISTGVFYGLFAGKLRSSSELPVHSIVVAAHDMDRGTVIQPGDLRVAEVEGVLQGGFSKPEDAAGATLLTAVKANEPLLEERISARAPETGGAGGAVPNGMRAVTMHIFQSESLLNLLHSGSRVDLQSVSDRNGTTELRTVLENVPVLAVSAPDSNGNHPNGAAVTVLVRAEEADLVALADSGSHIRLALRNPLDQGTTPRHPLSLATLFSATKLDGDAETRAAIAGDWDHPIQLHVRVLSVSDAALEDLRKDSTSVRSEGAWHISSLHSEDIAKQIERLEERHELEVIDGERLLAGIGRPISYHAGSKPYLLRVRFTPEWLAANQVVLRVSPSFGASSGPDAQLPDTSSFLLESTSNETDAQLFPGRAWEHRHLAILVFARGIPPASLALAHAGRRR